MSLETLDELEWWEVARQRGARVLPGGPGEGWRPASIPPQETGEAQGGRVRLPTGSLTVKELEAMLNALPFDATFVDAEDRVRYFTHGNERVFARSRAVLAERSSTATLPPASTRWTASWKDSVLESSNVPTSRSTCTAGSSTSSTSRCEMPVAPTWDASR